MPVVSIAKCIIASRKDTTDHLCGPLSWWHRDQNGLSHSVQSCLPWLTCADPGTKSCARPRSPLRRYSTVYAISHVLWNAPTTLRRSRLGKLPCDSGQGHNCQRHDGNKGLAALVCTSSKIDETVCGTRREVAHHDILRKQKNQWRRGT
jgi:hypothetical protein